MNIGRQCPRVHELGSLYPTKGLQKALCNYYAAIIRLCKHSTQSLRKPGIYICCSSSNFSTVPQRSPRIDTLVVYLQVSKALLVSFKAEFGPYEEEIARLSQEVLDEVSLASKKAQKQENELQAIERSEDKKFREDVVRFRNDYHMSKIEEKERRLEINRRMLEKRRLEILDTLSTYDYQKTYRQIRKECISGTSTWICEDPVLHAWMSGTLKTLRLIGRCKCTVVPNIQAWLK